MSPEFPPSLSAYKTQTRVFLVSEKHHNGRSKAFSCFESTFFCVVQNMDDLIHGNGGLYFFQEKYYIHLNDHDTNYFISFKYMLKIQ